MRTTLLVLCMTLAAVSVAGADEGEHERMPGALAIGAKVGVVLPQVATELGTTVGGELEFGYRLPLTFSRLSVYATVGYTQPKVSRTSTADPRLPAAYDGEQTQRELTAGLGGMIRWKRPSNKWNVYGAAGIRAYFLETITNGNAGSAEFGENTEKSTKVGGVGTLGGEYRLGGGAAALEAQFGTSDLSHTITGDVSTGAVVIMLGYRLFL